MTAAAALLEAGVRVVDLSADFRITDVTLWESWYQTSHLAPDLFEEAVYGLPEVNRDLIRQARLVAVPGWYPTAVQLGFLPLIEAGLLETSRLIADAKSGVSGAGRKAVEDFLYCEAGESIKAYESVVIVIIRKFVRTVPGQSGPVGLTFVPHLTPMIRGILATLYGQVKARCS